MCAYNTLKAHGLPQLVDRYHCEREPFKSHEHQPAAPMKGEFNILMDRELLDDQTCSIWVAKNSSRLQWYNEMDIRGYVKMVITSLIASAGLKDTLQYFHDQSLFGEQPGRSPLPINGARLSDLVNNTDIWTVLKGDIPVGIVAVKCPEARNDPEFVFRSKKIAGQMLDYMRRLETYYGVQSVFGTPRIASFPSLTIVTVLASVVHKMSHSPGGWLNLQ